MQKSGTLSGNFTHSVNHPQSGSDGSHEKKYKSCDVTLYSRVTQRRRILDQTCRGEKQECH